MALFDLSSSWLEGTHCPLGERGYSRDGKKGKVQIEYGLLTDPEGRPVAVRVLEGSTADPAAFTEIAEVVRNGFGLRKMVMVGDRGMITSARIDALQELDKNYGWITALRSPAIRKLMADDGPLQLSLFDEQDLAEITSLGLPRRAAGRLPQPGAGRASAPASARTCSPPPRSSSPPSSPASRGRLAGEAAIGTAVGKVIGKYKMAKHFDVTITGTSLTAERRQDQIGEEAALDGIYVIRTPSRRNPRHRSRGHRLQEPQARRARLPAHQIRRPGPAPVFHRLEKRVKGHVLICMLAAYLTWHLRQAWAPLTYTDEDPPPQANPVAPARRSGHADAKASRQRDEAAGPTAASAACSPTSVP